MDIDGDGIKDIVSGSYAGAISYYKVTKNGIEYPVELKQTTNNKNSKIFYELLFTNPTFGDINGDGLMDAIIGGTKGPRYMLNQGTKEVPLFGERMPLLDVEGNQIDIKDLTPSEKEKMATQGVTCADFKTYVTLLDWDRDGVNDIITTSSYSQKGVNAIDFLRGVKTDNGMRFEKRVPLFTSKDGGKALPGEILIPHFCDYNNDGALDILLGISTSELEPTEKQMKNGYVILIPSKKHYK